MKSGSFTVTISSTSPILPVIVCAAGARAYRFFEFFTAQIRKYFVGVFMPPAIPPITAPDLIKAVSALTRAAVSYRSVLFIVAEAIGDQAFEHLLKHEDVLNLSDVVINAWRQQLGHDVEDGEVDLA